MAHSSSKQTAAPAADKAAVAEGNGQVDTDPVKPEGGPCANCDADASWVSDGVSANVVRWCDRCRPDSRTGVLAL